MVIIIFFSDSNNLIKKRNTTGYSDKMCLLDLTKYRMSQTGSNFFNGGNNPGSNVCLMMALLIN